MMPTYQPAAEDTGIFPEIAAFYRDVASGGDVVSGLAPFDRDEVFEWVSWSGSSPEKQIVEEAKKLACRGEPASEQSWAEAERAIRALLQVGKRPTRVAPSIVGGVGITIAVHGGYIYIEAQNNEDDQEHPQVIGKRVVLKGGTEIHSLRDFDSNLSAFIDWAVRD